MALDEAIIYSEEFYLNSTGFKLFTCTWLPPSNTPIKALLFLCHDTAIRFAKSGFGVFGIDCQGHGKSEGLRCYIDSFHQLALDSATYFATVKDNQEFEGKPSFLLGESMGGAVALYIHRFQPNEWNGAILVAPMCKMSKELHPSPIMMFILTKIVLIGPTWKMVPTRNILDTGFQDPIKREKIRANPYIYLDKPRFKTTLELLNAAFDLEKNISEVSLPFLVLHGKKDLIIDPLMSENLYKSSKSMDKTIKIYPDMWHALITAESNFNMDIVFSDINTWLNDRIPPTFASDNKGIMRQL